MPLLNISVKKIGGTSLSILSQVWTSTSLGSMVSPNWTSSKKWVTTKKSTIFQVFIYLIQEWASSPEKITSARTLCSSDASFQTITNSFQSHGTYLKIITIWNPITNAANKERPKHLSWNPRPVAKVEEFTWLETSRNSGITKSTLSKGICTSLTWLTGWNLTWEFMCWLQDLTRWEFSYTKKDWPGLQLKNTRLLDHKI